MFTRCMGEGGTEKIIMQLSEALIKNGHKVIICADGGGSEKKINEMGICLYKIPDM